MPTDSTLFWPILKPRSFEAQQQANASGAPLQCTVAIGVGWRLLELWTHCEQCERLIHAGEHIGNTLHTVHTMWTSNTLLVSIVLHCMFFSWLLNYHSSQNILILLFLSFSWKYPQMALTILETYTCQLLRILDWPCVSFPRMGVAYVQVFFIGFFDQEIWTKARILFPP